MSYFLIILVLLGFSHAQPTFVQKTSSYSGCYDCWTTTMTQCHCVLFEGGGSATNYCGSEYLHLTIYGWSSDCEHVSYPNDVTLGYCHTDIMGGSFKFECPSGSGNPCSQQSPVDVSSNQQQVNMVRFLPLGGSLFGPLHNLTVRQANGTTTLNTVVHLTNQHSRASSQRSSSLRRFSAPSPFVNEEDFFHVSLIPFRNPNGTTNQHHQRTMKLLERFSSKKSSRGLKDNAIFSRLQLHSSSGSTSHKVHVRALLSDVSCTETESVQSCRITLLPNALSHVRAAKGDVVAVAFRGVVVLVLQR